MQADEIGEVLCKDTEPFLSSDMTYKNPDIKEDVSMEETRYVEYGNFLFYLSFYSLNLYLTSRY